MVIIQKPLELCGKIIPAIDANGTITYFSADNNSALFKVKTKTASRTGNDGTKDVKQCNSIIKLFK